MSAQAVEHPLRWLKQIPRELFLLDEKPLMTAPAPFPWEAFTQFISKHFGIQDVEFESGEWQWRSQEDLFSGLSANHRGVLLSVAPLEGRLWWVMSEEDVATLASVLLTQEKDASLESIGEEFLSTFYRFLAVEAVYAFHQVNSDHELRVSLGVDDEVPDEPGLCMDVTLRFGTISLHGRLILSSQFRKSWVEHYRQTVDPLKSPMMDSLETIVHFEIGRLPISRREWSKVVPGDFVIASDCLWSDEEGKERVMLTIAETPFFRARIKNGKLKVLEHPLYYEVDAMADIPSEENKHEHDENDEMDGFDLDSLEKKLFAAGKLSLPGMQGDIKKAPPEKEASLPDQEQQAQSEMEEIGDESIDESMEERVDDEPVEEEAADKLTDQAMHKEPQAHEKEAPKNIEDIPLSIVIEIGRMQMSIRQLLELQPGNMLDIDLHPEKGVDLVVQGKKVARGELLQIGESLGVRILELL